MDNLDEADCQAVIQWYHQQQYYNGMLQQAKQALQTFPSSDTIKLLLAVAYVLTNRVQEALQAVTNLIGPDDTTLPALIIQSAAHKLNGGKDRALVTQIDAKIRENRRKATATALARAGNVSLMLNKIDKAKEYADRAYRINSNDLEVTLINGWIDLNVFKGKRKDYFGSIAKDYSRKLNVLLGLAKFHEYNGAHEQAVLILNALIVRYPKLCLPLVEKMLNQLAVKDWEQVLETANRILSLDSNNLDAIKAKTIVSLCRDGDYDAGSKNIQLYFRNLFIAEPKNVQVVVDNIQLFSGIINRDEGALAELLKISEKLIQQNSNISEPMVELGNVYLLMNKFKEAEHWYRSAVKIDESSFTALTGLANCQVLDATSGASDLARQQLDFLMEIQSNTMNPKLYFMSAKLCSSDSIKALSYLDMAIKLILKNCENMNYGNKYLKELNPDFCLEIVNDHLMHSPTISTLQEDEKILEIEKPTLKLLKKVSESCPGFGQALLMLGKASMQCGYFDEALSALKKLIDFIDPANPAAHILMAQIFARQGNYTLASQSLEVGLSYNFKVRDDPLYYLITGIIEKENDNFENCISSLQTAMTLMDNNNKIDRLSMTLMTSSDRATLYLELILAYTKLQKLDEASALMSEAKMQFMNTVEEGRVMIGNAELCLEAGDIDKAVDYLNDIQPGQPYYLQAHTKLAEINLHQRKDRQAFAKCFRELVEHCPGPKTYNMLGDAYMAIQEPDRAIEAYEESLKNNSTDKILASKMGRALVKTHQYTKAINYYKEIVEHKGCADLKLDMAELFMRMKQYDKADSILLQELQDGRTGADLASLEIRVKQLLLLAKVRERAGNITSAIATLKEAKESQVRCIQRASMGSGIVIHKQILADICLTMANHCTAVRDFDGAIGHFKDALQQKPTDVNALLSLAKLYMQINDLDKCAQSCTTLLTADPNNEAASVMMADLAFRKVDFETAAYHFRQLLLRRPTYWTALARLIEVSRRTGNLFILNFKKHIFYTKPYNFK